MNYSVWGLALCLLAPYFQHFYALRNARDLHARLENSGFIVHPSSFFVLLVCLTVLLLISLVII